MSNEKYYRISEQALLEFIDSYVTLQALQFGGVDNWSWYSDSLSDYLEFYKEANKEYIKQAKDSILDMEPDEDISFDDIPYVELNAWQEDEI